MISFNTSSHVKVKGLRSSYIVNWAYRRLRSTLLIVHQLLSPVDASTILVSRIAANFNLLVILKVRLVDFVMFHTLFTPALASWLNLSFVYSRAHHSDV
jgi:hypothetical protein